MKSSSNFNKNKTKKNKTTINLDVLHTPKLSASSNHLEDYLNCPLRLMVSQCIRFVAF